MAFDLQKFLRDEVGFKDEAVIAEIAAKFPADSGARLEAGFVSAQDRAAVAAARVEITNTQTQLKTANDKLNAEIAEWASLTSSEKEQSTQLRDSLHASQAEVLALQQSLTTVAAQAGIDPKTVMPAVKKVEPPVEAKPAAVDMSKYVPIDTFGQVSRFSLEVAAAMPFIAQQHQELTGKALDTRTIVAEITKRAGKNGAIVDPVAIWEEMHGIPAIRETKAAEARAAEIAAAEQRGEERARTNMSIPGTSTIRSARPSPVLGQRDAASGQFGHRTSVLKRPQPETGVMSAANAFRTGKYREKTA